MQFFSEFASLHNLKSQIYLLFTNVTMLYLLDLLTFFHYISKCLMLLIPVHIVPPLCPLAAGANY